MEGRVDIGIIVVIIIIIIIITIIILLLFRLLVRIIYGLKFRKKRRNCYHHRLNGSSSPVLTATPHSYGKGQNSTPYKIKTPERIGMKYGTVDYVLEICPQNKFSDDRSRGGFWVNM